jgi:HlyD family secretion protein
VNGRPIRLLLFSGTGLLLLLFAASASLRSEPARGEIPTVTAERRTLEVTLVEPGTLQAARSVTLASEIRSNRAKIVSILGDGTWVRPGDVVVAFDRTPFEEERDKLAAELHDAAATVVRAEQERKLSVAKAEEGLESARARLKIAGLQQEAFTKGSGPITVREAEIVAAEGRSELDRAREELADMERMLERGFVSEAELSRQRTRVTDLERRASLAGQKFETARDVLVPRDLERAKTEAADAREAVARAEAVLYHTHEFYRAAVQSAERRVDAARTALRAAEAALEQTSIQAPIEGFLVLQEIPLDTGKRKPQVGDSVWSGQPIATIPDLSQMIVETRVREVDLHRVATGLEAAIEVEAYPDLRLAGRIDFIGSLAEPEADAPWKYFAVRVGLERSDPRLRPGMSARIAYALDRAADVVVLPIDAVFTAGDRSVCYVRRDGTIWEEPVGLGKRNETHVEIRSGVAPGEEVLLVVPSGGARRRSGARADA